MIVAAGGVSRDGPARLGAKRRAQDRSSRRSDDVAAGSVRVAESRRWLAEMEAVAEVIAARRAAVAEQYEAFPASERGWPVEVVVLVNATALALFAYPAWVETAAFSVDPRERLALAVVLALTGLLLGVVFGELLRRYRKPRAHSLVDRAILVYVIFSVIAYLGTSLTLDLSFGATRHDAAQTVRPVIDDALTLFAAMGIGLAVIAGYYRESLLAGRVRRLLRATTADVVQSELDLEAAKLSLTKRAAAAGYERTREAPQIDVDWLSREQGRRAARVPNVDVARSTLARHQEAVTPLESIEPLPLETLAKIKELSTELNVQFRGEREGYLYFKRVNDRVPLSYNGGLQIAKELVDAIRSSSDEGVREALERHRGVRLG